MEEFGNPRSVRLVMAGMLLFLLAGFQSCQEIRYRLGSKVASGRVYQVAEAKNRGEHVGYDVYYRFRDDKAGVNDSGASTVGIDEGGKYSVGQEIDVEYLAAGKTSRIKGINNNGWLTVFVGSIVASAVFIGVMTVRAYRRGELS